METPSPLKLIPPDEIDRAARLILAASPAGSKVILFGSYARGDATVDSDLDFLVIEPEVRNAHRESVRLRDAAGEVRAPMDVIVVSRERFERWKTLWCSTVMAEAARYGRSYRHGD